MSRFLRAWLVLGVLGSAGTATAADVKAIDQAIDKGKAYLKARFANAKPVENIGGEGNYGIGPTALAGVTLLEARLPADDPTIKAITAAVRESAYSESKTYQIALCLMYLDRLEDPADVPMIQVLALRLLAGQNGMGGWGYSSVSSVPGDHVAWLKGNLKVEPPKEREPNSPKPPPKLHPDVATYAASIKRPEQGGADDNSNTQFAILGLWLARKHGVPVEAALDLIDKRFRASQDPQSGGWGYLGPVGGIAMTGLATPSMTCCGLLGLATGNARRVEKRPRTETLATKPPMSKEDPFFTTPTNPEKKAEKAPEIRDPAALRALAGLGAAFARYVQNGTVLAESEVHGDRDLYFLWSVERVGVIYNIEKLGGIDWYEVGADAIVKAQLAQGCWSNKSYGADVNTCLALLFLMKADLLRDLSNKFKNAKDNELRAGTSGATPMGGTGNGTETSPMPRNTGPSTPALPSPVQDAATKLANELLLAPETDWSKSLEKLRDTKGADNTRGLVIAIHRLDGDRKKEARSALAERLTRMTADTLKGMMGSDDEELRRGSVLAAAMKDDKAHIPDLIDRMLDEDELVVRAARAGLKSLTSQDFGPNNGATGDERRAAAAAWKAWWAKQK